MGAESVKYLLYVTISFYVFFANLFLEFISDIGQLLDYSNYIFCTMPWASLIKQKYIFINI